MLKWLSLNIFQHVNDKVSLNHGLPGPIIIKVLQTLKKQLLFTFVEITTGKYVNVYSLGE